ncbi:MAG: peptidylprolyl isomerase [Spirochaetota bacterium]|nr:peptidylprolyl isomerase [Spirochaetota bacterium]
MRQVQNGNQVLVHYTGKLEDGTIFDSSSGRDPLAFQVGSGQVINGFDQGVIGMQEGDKKTVSLSPENAYGERHDNYIQEVDKNIFDGSDELNQGQEVSLQNESGNIFKGIINEIKDEKVVIDFNHPLAGKTLIFDLELVAIS